MSWDWLFTFTDPTIDWNYAMVTLVVRFIGVFVVMAFMQVALQISSRIVRQIEGRREAAAAPHLAVPAGEPASTHAVVEAVDVLTAAAIGTALALETGAATVGATTEAAGSTWALAGRMRQLQRAPR